MSSRGRISARGRGTWKKQASRSVQATARDGARAAQDRCHQGRPRPEEPAEEPPGPPGAPPLCSRLSTQRPAAWRLCATGRPLLRMSTCIRSCRTSGTDAQVGYLLAPQTGTPPTFVSNCGAWAPQPGTPPPLSCTPLCPSLIPPLTFPPFARPGAHCGRGWERPGLL